MVRGAVRHSFTERGGNPVWRSRPANTIEEAQMEDGRFMVPVGFQQFLFNIFGRDKIPVKPGPLKVQTWRKAAARICTAVKSAVKGNTATLDHWQRNDLLQLCESTRDCMKRKKSNDEVNTELITMLLELVFQLLGQMPRNWHRDSLQTRGMRMWDLSEFRTVSYSQTAGQKRDYLLWLCRTHLRSMVADFEEVQEKALVEYGVDVEGFLAWFKAEHPDVYVAVF